MTATATADDLDALFEALFITREASADGVARLAMARNEVTIGGVRESINGGLVAMLAELAGHMALRSVLEAGESIEGTVDLSLSYLSSARGARTVAEGRLLRKGGRLCVSEVEVRDGDSGAINARARVTCAIVRASHTAPAS